MNYGAISEADVLDLLMSLIRTPSVNPALDPASEGEAAVAELARDWLNERGVRAWLEEVAPGRPNMVAEVGSGAGPTLLMCGHLDTVSARGMTIEPFEPRLDGDRVYGRGSYDMKGGVCAIMAAAAALVDAEIGGRVVLALVVDEEHSSSGSEGFVAAHKGDGCIVTEPTDGRLILTHKGFVWARVTTTGEAAHGSRWDLGASAIGSMAPIIDGVTRFDRDVLRARVHADLGPASMHAALIEGGVGISTYAPSCTLQVERRTLPGESAESVEDELRTIIEASGERAALDVFFDRGPLSCAREEPVARAVCDAASAIAGEAPEETGVAYWTDAALFAAAGVPALCYGPGGEGAHADVEWVSLSSVVETARVLARAAVAFCGG